MIFSYEAYDGPAGGVVGVRYGAMDDTLFLYWLLWLLAYVGCHV
jgi:hypothetical protein